MMLYVELHVPEWKNCMC